MTTVKTITKALRDQNRPTLSFEFFPPKTEEATERLWSSFNELEKVNPDFVSVTYGAMGSNQETSLAIVERMAKTVPTIAHLTCIGATSENIASLLRSYDELGVAGILALRGDKPQGVIDLPDGDFNVALDLVEAVQVDSKFEIGVAAFPEKHPESPSLEHDLEVLKLKQNAGADFAMTQLFFDIDAYFSLVARAAKAGLDLPIVPGVMPIANAKQVLRMAEMSGAALPKKLVSQLAAASSDEVAREIGMNFTVELTKKLLDQGVPGVHIFTLNHHEAAIELATAVGLA